MTSGEKNIIAEYVLGRITKETLLNKYPYPLTDGDEYLFGKLEVAFQEKNAEDIEYLLYLLPIVNYRAANFPYDQILSKLLYENWHTQHENIVSLIQSFKSKEVVDSLYYLTSNSPIYLDYDDTYSLARNCLHALNSINTDYSINKLKGLAESNISIIKETAIKLLENRSDD